MITEVKAAYDLTNALARDVTALSNHRIVVGSRRAARRALSGFRSLRVIEFELVDHINLPDWLTNGGDAVHAIELVFDLDWAKLKLLQSTPQFLHTETRLVWTLQRI